MAKGNGTTKSGNPNYTSYQTIAAADAALSFSPLPGDYDDIFDWVAKGVHINAVLRGDVASDKEALDIAQKLDRRLAQSSLGKNVTLYRGDNSAAFKRMFGVEISESTISSLKGKVGSKKDFTSTYASVEAEGAEVQFKIKISGSHKGALYLQPIKSLRWNNTGENEVLLNRGIKFRITDARLGEGKTRTGRNRYVVTLKVV